MYVILNIFKQYEQYEVNEDIHARKISEEEEIYMIARNLHFLMILYPLDLDCRLPGYFQMFHKEERGFRQCRKEKERERKKRFSEEKAQRELLERISRRTAKANVRVLLETCPMLEEDKLLM